MQVVIGLDSGNDGTSRELMRVVVTEVTIMVGIMMGMCGDRRGNVMMGEVTDVVLVCVSLCGVVCVFR